MIKYNDTKTTYDQVDSFGQGSNVTVGMSGSEAGLVKDIQEDGDKVLLFSLPEINGDSSFCEC